MAPFTNRAPPTTAKVRPSRPSTMASRCCSGLRVPCEMNQAATPKHGPATRPDDAQLDQQAVEPGGGVAQLHVGHLGPELLDALVLLVCQFMA